MKQTNLLEVFVPVAGNKYSVQDIIKVVGFGRLCSLGYLEKIWPKYDPESGYYTVTEEQAKILLGGTHGKDSDKRRG